MVKSSMVIGLMSGTSLDGVDLAACSFFGSENAWRYRLHYCTTIAYPESWQEKLKVAHLLKPAELDKLDLDYGDFLSELVLEECLNAGLEPRLIASHGHTVFHDPENGVTRQIGDGTRILENLQLPVVYDFRSLDVAKGGQGAPLVPVGDKLLFGEYDACLNLGGFSNISFDHQGKRIAFDICPVNIVLNYLAGLAGNEYDKDGELGKAGQVNAGLLNKLDKLEYYDLRPPKSLAREWLEKHFLPLLEASALSLQDKVATLYQHIVNQLHRIFTDYELSAVLLTGGGALNTFLISELKQSCKTEIIIPDRQLVEFKEAIIFAFLGFLRQRGEINCYASVTGAKEDSIVGVLLKKEPRNDPGLHPN